MERGKYNEVKDEVISYIREGDTVKMACKKAGIIRDTFYRWQRDKPEFDEALKKARKEQGVITIDRGLVDFYKNYFDKIKSYE